MPAMHAFSRVEATTRLHSAKSAVARVRSGTVGCKEVCCVIGGSLYQRHVRDIRRSATHRTWKSQAVWAVRSTQTSGRIYDSRTRRTHSGGPSRESVAGAPKQRCASRPLDESLSIREQSSAVSIPPQAQPSRTLRPVRPAGSHHHCHGSGWSVLRTFPLGTATTSIDHLLRTSRNLFDVSKIQDYRLWAEYNHPDVYDDLFLLSTILIGTDEQWRMHHVLAAEFFSDR